MKIILKLVFVYLGIFGVTVECNFWPAIATFLHKSKIPIERDDTGEIIYKIPCGVSNFDTFATKIVGGTECAPYEFPWMASLQIKINRRFKHNCGCTIINEKFILTAGHCVHGITPDLLQVAAGIYNITDKNSEYSQYRAVKKIYADKYKVDNFENDIALLELYEVLKLTPGIVSPICLPRGNETFNDKACVAGWGRTTEGGDVSDIPLKVELDVIDKAQCDKIYTDKGYRYFLHNCQICTMTKDKDACQGDSGGSLMCRDVNNKKTYACGVVSWGAGCARPGNPGVYTNTTCYTPWIVDTVNKNL